MSSTSQKAELVAVDNSELGFRVTKPNSVGVWRDATDAGIRPDDTFVRMDVPQACRKTPRWWTIKSYGFSLEQQAGAAGFEQVSAQSIRSRGQQASGLKMFVSTGENEDFVVDVGAGRGISVMSRSISLGVVAPAGARRLDRGPIPGNPNDFAFVDLVDITLFDGPSPLGGQTGTLTRTYTCLAPPAANVFLIPPRAQRVQFFVPVGNGVLPVSFVSNPPAPRFNYGSVSFTPTLFETAIVNVPGDAIAIDLGAQIRQVTAVWELAW